MAWCRMKQKYGPGPLQPLVRRLRLAHRIFKSPESPAMITDSRFLFGVIEKVLTAFCAIRVKSLAVITNADIFLRVAEQMPATLCTFCIESLAMIAVPFLLFGVAEQGATAFLTGSHVCSPLLCQTSEHPSSPARLASCR